MVKSELINQVVRIILKHAKPERIYLHGSHADGSEKPGSDIDIAYDAPGFKDHFLIQEEVDRLQTLVKIDVSNIASAEERFRSRIRSTGRVLYSANKKLRAEDALHNFSKALDRLKLAMDRRPALADDGYGDMVLDILVKRFEFTFEMSWKAVRRYLDFIGIEALHPRAAFKEAFSQGLVSNEEIWLDMIEQRNVSSHTYDEIGVSDLKEKVEQYWQAFETLKREIDKRLQHA